VYVVEPFRPLETYWTPTDMTLRIAGQPRGANAASLSSETLARLDSSNSKQKLLFSPTRGAVTPGFAHRQLHSYAGGPTEGDVMSSGGLLRTMSLIGGHSRAGSVAGKKQVSRYADPGEGEGGGEGGGI